MSLPFSKKIKSRIPKGICLVTSEDVIDPNPSYYDIEEHYIARAVQKRKTEFREGRNCAREALLLLGENPSAIPVGKKGEPIWPMGFVGSITHCRGFCAAAVAEKTKYTAIGIDVEEQQKLSVGISFQILTEKERFNLDNTVDYFALLIFSAKESIFKCLYPLTNRTFDFLDINVVIDRIKMEFEVEIPIFTDLNTPLKKIEGRYILGDQYLFTIAYIPA